MTCTLTEPEAPARERFQRNAARVASHRCTVTAHHAVNARYRYLRLAADADLAALTRAGQFYQLRCPDVDGLHPFLLRPMSVYGLGPEAGTVEFLYAAAGTGTQALATLAEGQTMEIVGPLGRGFAFDPSWRRILLVARGVGLATMAPLVQQAARAGVAIDVLLSARSAADAMEAEFLRGAAARVERVHDEDGSSAVDRVAPHLARLLDDGCDAVFTCGSQRLALLLQDLLARRPAIHAEVALEQRMACGMGVCLSCVRPFAQDGRAELLRVCREGPVFPLRAMVGGWHG
ncbi:MAG: dihydroorotate dehydrogenase electron transfer subunit [Burkholderiales bacterium]|nr:dihydroorotate dehydrogenase electron transfer subunit [Burkholderiales bacterium]